MAQPKNKPENPVSQEFLVAKAAAPREPFKRLHWKGNSVLVSLLVKGPNGQGQYVPERWWVLFETCDGNIKLRERDGVYGVPIEGELAKMSTYTIEQAKAVLAKATRTENPPEEGVVRVLWFYEQKKVATGYYSEDEFLVTIEWDRIHHRATDFEGDEAMMLLDAGVLS